ncbi:MAG: hypothetical protein D3923_08000 [Candidatus Electrothrix sp. AR3]|nr:hypothetical protein [Candidatus Electrothrix sp. AR3]
MILKQLKNALLIALWFVFLTFPIMVIKVNPYERTVVWRWQNMLYVAAIAFFFALAGRTFQVLKGGRAEKQQGIKERVKKNGQFLLGAPRFFLPFSVLLLAILAVFPHVLSTYQINIMITALMYVVLGLGLNIVVGMAGLLDLGYVAFYAVGAYSYAKLDRYGSSGGDLP